ncbi:Translation initiation factor eIF3 subunit C [Gracilaria domingensis]|nr:Translation initiation factor eIF3 subunit C [Gracilaria domingensis]
MDWAKLQKDFDQLNDALKKIMKTDMVSGKKPPVPELYVRAIITIENFISDNFKDKLKLSKTNSKILNGMNLKIPKNNCLHKTEVDQLRAIGAPSLHDIPGDDSDSDFSSSEDDDDNLKDDLSGTDECTSTSTDSEDDNRGGKASMWLRKDKGEATTTAAKIRKEKKAKDVEAGAESNLDDNDGFTTVRRAETVIRETFKPDEMIEKAVDTKMLEVLRAHGRKGTNRTEQISLIESLVPCTKSPIQRIELVLHLISAKIDGIPAVKLFMTAKLWRSAVGDGQKFIALGPSIILKQTGTAETVDPSENTLVGMAVLTAAEEQVKKTEVDAEGQIIIRGDFVSNFQRCEDELFRAGNIGMHMLWNM